MPKREMRRKSLNKNPTGFGMGRKKGLSPAPPPDSGPQRRIEGGGGGFWKKRGPEWETGCYAVSDQETDSGYASAGVGGVPGRGESGKGWGARCQALHVPALYELGQLAGSMGSC